MRVRVGLTTSDLTSLKHKSVTVTAAGRATLAFLAGSETAAKQELPAGQTVTIELRDGKPALISVGSKPPAVKSTFDGFEIRGLDERTPLTIETLKRQHAKGKGSPSYVGTLIVTAVEGSLRLILETDLDTYVKGVLQSEIPASYHIEAVKAQAVAARTYALRPRLDHTSDQCQVCDSFLCCQYFAGNEVISARHAQAIESTAGEILTYESKPILALFSSCSGGHTESYVDCFSDPKSGAFPPPALSYLTAVSEGELPFDASDGISETDLRKLWRIAHPQTADAWSPHFRWHLALPAKSLEAHMHHQIAVLREDKEMAPFIVPPPSGQFGHIKSFQISKRGVAGSAIELTIETSTGAWKVRKELVIRSVFKNPEIGLARLKSARIFFDQSKDSLGLLSMVDVYGFGWGHGVGMQQTGAQGHALNGKTYREILTHYFSGASISKA